MKNTSGNSREGGLQRLSLLKIIYNYYKILFIRNNYLLKPETLPNDNRIYNNIGIRNIYSVLLRYGCDIFISKTFLIFYSTEFSCYYF